jgi:hypothetical protein
MSPDSGSASHRSQDPFTNRYSVRRETDANVHFPGQCYPVLRIVVVSFRRALGRICMPSQGFSCVVTRRGNKLEDVWLKNNAVEHKAGSRARRTKYSRISLIPN